MEFKDNSLAQQALRHAKLVALEKEPYLAMEIADMDTQHSASKSLQNLDIAHTTSLRLRTHQLSIACWKEVHVLAKDLLLDYGCQTCAQGGTKKG